MSIICNVVHAPAPDPPDTFNYPETMVLLSHTMYNMCIMMTNYPMLQVQGDHRKINTMEIIWAHELLHKLKCQWYKSWAWQLKLRNSSPLHFSIQLVRKTVINAHIKISVHFNHSHPLIRIHNCTVLEKYNPGFSNVVLLQCFTITMIMQTMCFHLPHHITETKNPANISQLMHCAILDTDDRTLKMKNLLSLLFLWWIFCWLQYLLMRCILRYISLFEKLKSHSHNDDCC